MVYVFYFWRLFRSWMWHSLRTNLLLARKDIRIINHHYSYGYIFIRSRSPLRHILDFQHRLRALRQDDPLFWSQGCWMKWYSWEKTYALKSPFFFPLEPWILSLPCIRLTWECWAWAWWRKYWFLYEMIAMKMLMTLTSSTIITIIQIVTCREIEVAFPSKSLAYLIAFIAQDVAFPVIWRSFPFCFSWIFLVFFLLCLRSFLLLFWSFPIPFCRLLFAPFLFPLLLFLHLPFLHFSPFLQSFRLLHLFLACNASLLTCEDSWT